MSTEPDRFLAEQNHQFTGNSDRRDKMREALGNFTSAFSYFFNVNRTSLDHFLFGNAPMSTRVSSSPSISRDRGVVSATVSLTFGLVHAGGPSYFPL